MVRSLWLFCMAWVLAVAPVLTYAQPAALSPTVVYDAASSRAQVLPARIQNVSPADFGRVWNGVLGGGVQVVDDVAAKVGGKDVILKSSRTIPWSGAAKVIAKGFLGPVGAAMTVKSIADGVRCKVDTGSFLCDDGQGTSVITVTKSFMHPPGISEPFMGNSPTDVCGMINGQHVIESGFHYDLSNALYWQPDGRCYYDRRLVAPSCTVPAGCAADRRSVAVTSSSTSETKCPAVVNFSDPAYSQPGGPPMADGKCPTGQYSGKTEDQVAQKVDQYADKDKARDAVREAVEKGVDATPEAGPQTLSGPTSVTGPTTTSTTTAPNGSPQTTTTTTVHTVTYNTTNNYYSWSSQTTTTNPDGTTTTTTTDPQPTDCDKDPSSVGCQKLDTPVGPATPTKDIPIAVTPMTGWGADNAACPAPYTGMLLGQPWTFSYQLVCDFATGIRFAVVGVAGLVAAFILLGYRSGD